MSEESEVGDQRFTPSLVTAVFRELEHAGYHRPRTSWEAYERATGAAVSALEQLVVVFEGGATGLTD